MRMATRTRKVVGYGGGLESSASGLGSFMLGVGIAALLVSMIVASNSYSARGLWIALGIAGFLGGIVWFVVFRAVAEIVRLLKRLNGLTYAGTISQARPIEATVCSECGGRLYDWRSSAPQQFGEDPEASGRRPRCPHCGVELTTDATSCD